MKREWKPKRTCQGKRFRCPYLNLKSYSIGPVCDRIGCHLGNVWVNADYEYPERAGGCPIESIVITEKPKAAPSD